VGNSKFSKISIAKRNDGGEEKALLKKYGRDWKGDRHTVRHGGLCLPDSVVDDGSCIKDVVLVVNSMLECFGNLFVVSSLCARFQRFDSFMQSLLGYGQCGGNMMLLNSDCLDCSS